MARDADGASQSRRLQISGGSTYIISLPKNWVRDLGISVGDHVTMVKNPNRSLTLFSGDGQAEAKSRAIIRVGKKDTSESITRKIIATYLDGYKTIQIRSKGVRIQAEHAKAIRGLVRTSMIGTEVVESSSETITIQVLTRLPELSFETALKRMYLMAANMHTEAMEALSCADVPHSEEIVKMDDEVDRFSLYMRRNLAMSVANARVLQDVGLKRASDCLGYRTVIGRIERIADHAALIAKRIKFVDGKIDPGIMKKISAASGQALRVFENAIAALESRNYEMAERVAGQVRDAVESEKSIMSDVRDSAKNAGVIRFILEDIRRTAEYAGDIAEVAIDENIGSVVTK